LRSIYKHLKTKNPLFHLKIKTFFCTCSRGPNDVFSPFSKMPIRVSISLLAGNVVIRLSAWSYNWTIRSRAMTSASLPAPCSDHPLFCWPGGSLKGTVSRSIV
jgi:hypothetical protein